MKKDMKTIMPLVKLSPREWKIIDAGPDHFGISVYGRVVGDDLVRHWQKWSIGDFPNDLFGLEDLELAGLGWRYIAAIEKAELDTAAFHLRRAAERVEGNKICPDDNSVAPAVVSLGRKALDFFLHIFLPTRFFQRAR